MTDKTETIPLAKMLRALGSLWCPEAGELELRVQHTLTEPTCPTAYIGLEDDEGHEWPVFRADDDTIQKAIRGCVEAAYATLIERQPKPQTVPWSEPSEDEKVSRFLKAIDDFKASRP